MLLITGAPARLHIPVFRNLFFGPPNPFLTGFLRISFFPAFSGGFFHSNMVLEGVARIPVFPLLQDFFAGIPAGQEFLYYSGFLRNPEDSSGFLFPPKAVWLGQGTNSPPTSSPTSKLTCSPMRVEALPPQVLPSTPGGSTAAERCRQAGQRQ